MPTTYQNNSSEGKQFRLVKYFALASFFIIVIFSVPFSLFLSTKAKDILTKNYENYALLLGENLYHQVYQNFMIPVVVMQRETIKLSDEKQRELMDKIVRNAIHGFNVDVVNLYAIDQEVIAYSTKPELIGKKAEKTAGYKKAIQGQPSSELISEGGTYLGLGIDRIGSEKKIRAYIPLRLIERHTGQEFVVTVFEIIQDMTEQYKSIVEFQLLILGLSILIMALIFTALLLVVHKAERMIEQRVKEQRKLEEQLHLAERLAALGEMVAGVSHEIKNPLGIIKSTAELLSDMPQADETQKRLSGIITQESIRLNGIVTEFLDFARPQSLNVRECRLDEIIRKNLSFLAPEFEKKGIQIHENLGDRSLKLHADQDLLYRALMNIFINSIQSIDDYGSITIRVNEGREHYQLEIEDTGEGITRENMKKIFNPFFTTKEKGSGLGLPMVKKIIEEHKGTIDIESKEGSGTKVTIHLPKS